MKLRPHNPAWIRPMDFGVAALRQSAADYIPAPGGALPRRRYEGAARALAAFTMVEIAISLAVIGFALVAIIGVMPIGMNAQRDNREETIVNQDALVLASAIRNGVRGYEDLTNHVTAITNYWTDYEVTATSTNVDRDGANWYTPTNARGRVVGGAQVPLDYGISNGFRIVGLLTTPKYVGFDGGFRSNYVTATVRAFSGLASEKAPQSNPDVMAGAFTYRLICENQPLPAYSGTNVPAQLKQLTNNLRDLRLTFRWPITPRGVPGNGRQSFRTTVGGQLIRTNDLYRPNHPVYFFEPRSFELAP